MAYHASAEKRDRQRIKRTARNRAIRSTVRTCVKRVRLAVEKKNKEAAKKALVSAVRALDRAAKKGVLHKRSASRTVARLSAAVHKL